MRKKIFGKQLARGRKARTALFRSLIDAVVVNGQIETTKTKAKAIQPQLDKLISTAKKNTESSRRLVFARLGNNTLATEKLIKEYLPAFGERTSGFTRIVNLPTRVGDRAEMVRLEFVDKLKKSTSSGDKLQAKSE